MNVGQLKKVSVKSIEEALEMYRLWKEEGKPGEKYKVHFNSYDGEGAFVFDRNDDTFIIE
jgi:hypothetical protein